MPIGSEGVAVEVKDAFPVLAPTTCETDSASSKSAASQSDLLKKLRGSGQKVVIINRVIHRKEVVAGFSTWGEEAKPPPQRQGTISVVDQALTASLDAVAKRVPVLSPVRAHLNLINGTMPTAAKRAAGQHQLVRLLDALLRGIGQVVICNNPLTGLLVLAGLFAAGVPTGEHEGAAYVAVCGLLGVLGATLGAAGLRLDAHAAASGLFGYNGLLVGLGAATFVSGRWDAGVLVIAPLLGALTTVLQLSWGNLLIPTIQSPPFTLAFNTALLWFLLGCRSFGQFQVVVDPTLAPPDAPRSSDGASLPFLLKAALTAVGQIFLCQSWLSGVLVLCGMAVCSRIMALACYAGAFIACGLAIALGVPSAEVGAGLWGYNSALTAVAVLTFFLPKPAALVMGLIAVAFTLLLDGACRAVALPLGSPIGTLPFCIAAVTTMLVKQAVQGFLPIPIPDVSTPEDHLFSDQITDGRRSSLSTRRDAEPKHSHERVRVLLKRRPAAKPSTKK